MIQGSGQAGSSPPKGACARCWEKICAFFRRFFCCACSSTRRVGGTQQRQSSSVPLSQRATVPTSVAGGQRVTSATTTVTLPNRPRADVGKPQRFRAWNDGQYQVDMPRYVSNPARIADALDAFRNANNGNLFNHIRDPHGAAGIACRIAAESPGVKQGIMIAGNSGKICGGHADSRFRFKKGGIENQQTGQEESLVGNSFMTRFGTDKEAMDACYQNDFRDVLGMEKQYPIKDDHATLQGVDYWNLVDPSLFGDAYVYDTEVSVFSFEGSGNYDSHGNEIIAVAKDLDGNLKYEADDENYPVKKAPVTFVFCAAPNAAGARHDDDQRVGAMARTTCRGAFVTKKDLKRRNKDQIIQDKYQFFKDGIKDALRASMDAAIDSEIKIFHVAKLGSNIYAGKIFRDWIRADYYGLLNEVLNEEVKFKKIDQHGNTVQVLGERRAQYFERVILADIDRTARQ